jgi:ribosomal protein S18 acetylase RimI-like enzyme
VYTLLPLTPEHAALLQAVYDAAPGYWARYHLPGAPPGQAAQDLADAAATPGRTLLGILRAVRPDQPTAGREMVGMLDIRLHHPSEGTASIGMVMVAEPRQRQGVGRAAWALLEPWLRDTARVRTARLHVEQFNTPALKFFTALGFQMTGEAQRVRVGDAFVRLLYMEKPLTLR